MIVHHNQKYVFVHIPKTGGSNVSRVLKKYFEGNDESKPGSGRRFWRTHAIPKNWDNWENTIGLLRSPFEWYVSVFHQVKASIDGILPRIIPPGSKISHRLPGGGDYKIVPSLACHVGSRNRDLKELGYSNEKEQFQDFLLHLIADNENKDWAIVNNSPNDDWLGKVITFEKLYGSLGVYSRYFVMQYCNNDYGEWVDGSSKITHFIRTSHMNSDILNIFRDIGFDCAKFEEDMGYLDQVREDLRNGKYLEAQRLLGEGDFIPNIATNLKMDVKLLEDIQSINQFGSKKIDYMDWYSKELKDIVYYKDAHIFNMINRIEGGKLK